MPGEGHARRRGARGALLLLVAAACTRPVAAPSPAPAADACLIAPPAATAGTDADSLTIAYTARGAEGVSAPALVDAGGFVLRLTRRNLIRVNCTGAIVPDLASRWLVDSASGRWTFTIADAARWPNGEPVTSRDVIAAWRSTRGIQGEETTGIMDSAVAIDLRHLVVPVGKEGARLLAAPGLSVAMREPGRDRVLGTGMYRVDGDDDLALLPNDFFAGVPRIRLVPIDPAADARDALDRGVDLLLTDDAAVARYARTRESLAVHALPAQRIYSVVSPVAAAPAPEAEAWLHPLRASLAEEVVRVPAHASVDAAWWKRAPDCPTRDGGAATVARPVLGRVAYREDDPVARAIAERLVSLAQRGDDSVAAYLLGVQDAGVAAQLAAEPLSPASFASALREGARAAFIVSVPARPLARCEALADLARAMPWAGDRGPAVGGTPLLEAGGWAIVRHGAVGITIDWDGTPRLVFSETASASGAR